jgi:hypothetical protein
MDGVVDERGTFVKKPQRVNGAQQPHRKTADLRVIGENIINYDYRALVMLTCTRYKYNYKSKVQYKPVLARHSHVMLRGY